MIVSEMASRIESAALGLTRPPAAPGNLFTYHLPALPDFAAVVIPGPGLPPDVLLYPANSALDNWRLAIWVRHKTPSVAHATAMSIYLDVADINNTTIEGVRWLYCRPLSPPFVMEVDKERRTIVALNVQVKRESVA